MTEAASAQMANASDSVRNVINMEVTTPTKVWQAREDVCILKCLSTERLPHCH